MDYAASYQNTAASDGGAVEGNDNERILSIIGKIDPAEVLGWNVQTVVERFLIPIGLGQYAEEFQANAITGRVITNLTKDDLREIGVKSVGHRVIMAEGMKILNKKSVDLQRNQSLWKSQSPHPGGHYGYYDGCCNWLSYKICGPCRSRTSFNVTTRGIKQRSLPGCCCRGMKSVSQDFVDFRFVKDIELDSYPACGCCFMTHQVTIHSDDATNPTIKILHPEVAKLEKLVRNSWADARLTADVGA